MEEQNKEQRAREILEKMLRNEQVSRWDVSILRTQIRDLIRKEEQYQELEYEVEDLIDSANLSR